VLETIPDFCCQPFIENSPNSRVDQFECCEYLVSFACCLTNTVTQIRLEAWQQRPTGFYYQAGGSGAEAESEYDPISQCFCQSAAPPEQ